MPQIGDMIDGKYRIDRQIGEGGMGEVFEVTHVKLGKRYAIKVVRDAALSSPGIAERFMREAKAASALNSEHVGNVIDVGELANGAPFIQMELLQGRDLERICMQGPLAAPVAVDYILQACEAIAEAHAHGMVHRDIKPANLFLAERSNGTTIIKVLDFGIATAQGGEVSSLTNTNMVMGSPQFMSPEQLRTSRDVGPRADIWALGVTLYVLLSCRLPFNGTSFSELSIQIATEPHLRLNFIPPELADVIDRCMAKAPEARYPTIAELAFALAPFTADGAAAAKRAASLLSGGTGNHPAQQRPAGPPQAVTPLPPGAHAHTQATGQGYVPGKPTTLGASAAQLQSDVAKKGGGARWIAVLALVGAVGIGTAVFVSMRRPSEPVPPSTQPIATSKPATPPDAPKVESIAPDAAAAPTMISTHLEISIEPADATITIDGTSYPNPLKDTISLAPGPHLLRAEAKGHESFEMIITPGTMTDPLREKLKKVRTATAAAKTTPSTKTVPTPAPDGTTVPKTGYTGKTGELQTNMDIFNTPPSPAPKK